MAAITVVLQNSAPTPELAECLAEVIPGYPDDFVEVGLIPIPEGYGAGMSLGTTLRVHELEG
jgi:hypothetical protein